ncbi:hypothetical protein [Amycolatopsis rubida]|uniref:hypothetical protein n=1 Tax=Amycolatopsis rubida TaxID=112413 RepID=UPI00142F3BD1|nr:hypothetical protein [Amycolatopsis rubida]
MAEHARHVVLTQAAVHVQAPGKGVDPFGQRPHGASSPPATSTQVPGSTAAA